MIVEPPPVSSKDTAPLYKVSRLDGRYAGWSIKVSRWGHLHVSRLFRDWAYGSSQAALAEALAYRDAVMKLVPPTTNYEKLTQRRKNSKSGVPGVRRIIDNGGYPFWVATYETGNARKSRHFSVGKYGEDRAHAHALETRQQWLEGYELEFAVDNPRAFAIAEDVFAERLAGLRGQLVTERYHDPAFKEKLAGINAEFDAREPRQLNIRVRPDHVSLKGQRDVYVLVETAGNDKRKQAKRINQFSPRLLADEHIAGKTQALLKAQITDLYNEAVGDWFFLSHGHHIVPNVLDWRKSLALHVLVPNELLQERSVALGGR